MTWGRATEWGCLRAPCRGCIWAGAPQDLPPLFPGQSLSHSTGGGKGLVGERRQDTLTPPTARDLEDAGREQGLWIHAERDSRFLQGPCLRA